MKYRLISIDLDDTLLNNDREVSKVNIEAIKKVKDNGVTVVVCTGRPTKSTLQIVKEIGLFDEDEFVVSFNGAVITRVTGEPVNKYVINKNEFDLLVDLGREYNIDVQCYDDDGVIVERYTTRTKEYEDMVGSTCRMIGDLKILDGSIKVLFNSSDIEKLTKVRDKINNEMNDEIHAFFSKPTFLEVLNKNCNKGIATKYIADQYNVSQEEVIAIGDSTNDAFMIEYAGLGVCVKNGREEVKEIADYITESTNHEDAVAEVIKKFVL